jgi:hypothetical protein
MKKILIVPLAVVLSGCGILFVGGPAPNWESATDGRALQNMAISQPCTDSQFLPKIDGILAGLNLVGGAYLLATDADGWRDFYSEADRERNRNGGISLGWSAIQALSFGIGKKKVDDCRAFNVKMLELTGGNNK